MRVKLRHSAHVGNNSIILRRPDFREGRLRQTRLKQGQTDRQTDRPSTVTLAAHARRGLIIPTRMEGSYKREQHAQ